MYLVIYRGHCGPHKAEIMRLWQIAEMCRLWKQDWLNETLTVYRVKRNKGVEQLVIRKENHGITLFTKDDEPVAEYNEWPE